MPMIACALFGLLVAVVVLHTRGALGRPAYSPEPVHEVYAGRTDDGGHIRFERNGDAYKWRVDSPATSRCAVTRYRMDATSTEGRRYLLATDGSFAQNGRFSARFDRPFRRSLPGVVSSSLVGQLDDGRVTGRFVRHDQMYRRGGKVLHADCVRRAGFDVGRR